MNKRVGAVFLCLCMFLSLAGCGGTPANSSSTLQMDSESRDSSTGSSDAVENTSADTQKYVDMLSPALKEFGETGKVENLSVDAPEEIESTDSQYQTIHFTVSDRALQAQVLITGAEEKLISISKEEDVFHYYYYPNAQQVNDLGVIQVKLFDYKSDKPVDMEGLANDAQTQSEEQFMSIIESFPFAEYIQDRSDDSGYMVAINLDTSSIESDTVDANGIAMMWYYQLQLFLTDVCDSEKLESYPRGILGFSVNIDGNEIGTMTMYTSPEYGLFGTSKPIIIDEQYQQAFSDMYDEYIMDTLDQSNFSS